MGQFQLLKTAPDMNQRYTQPAPFQEECTKTSKQHVHMSDISILLSKCNILLKKIKVDLGDNNCFHMRTYLGS